ncbi:DUF946 domain-containing protein/DUF1162 domain-containing protein/Chorein_N domain-containing protein [Cephalotus follicularis]|uniref:DUF946 domain-containing protein/DUF1162 domain-containing protein/Chorein_N domain-containing protein n=1 Tax=Cephalotus follicularis TaxID=3775 RepID=A0A1Q3BUK0_CEPFO|nr:DUF946 domain-containing protein/DUF1162 domain-containing protein/Chorein_N domain-containing protein [Cephalotus follicularis]
MFEAHVLHLLRKYLGEYVHGLSVEALRISVWKGDVVLKDLRLKAEALNSLKLPVTVKAGFVGTITLKVPWKSLGKEPVIVLIDRVFILAHPVIDARTLKEEDRKKLFEAKLQQIEEAESATLEAISRSKLGSPPPGNSWLGSLIATVIGNLKISISNVHIRYEDSVSNSGHPFCSGVTLAKLAAVTMDEQGNETFDTSGALDKLRKSLQLERLAMYHDSNILPWKTEKRWEDLSPKEWVEIFEDGINEASVDCGMVSKWARNRNYLVSPINGVLKYHRLGNQERTDPEIPFEKASLVLSDVSFTISEEQYHDWIKLLEVVSRYKTYIDVSHLRPVVPVSEGPCLWWRYAAQASLQQRKMCYKFSWDRIRHLCQLRRRYVQLYAGLLQQSSNVNNSDIREIEKDLDSKVILLWRLLAHAKVESVKSKEAAEQQRLKKKSWFSFSWGESSGDASVGDASEGLQLTEERLTKEEWQAINNLLSYQPDEELTSHSGKDMQNMIQFLVTVSVGQAAARIIDINQTEVVCGRFEQLNVSTKFKHRSTHCDVSLRFYGVSAPEGSLAQSVCSEEKVNALTAGFVHSPVGENVDWRLSATISPCHVTVLMESCDRFFEFVKRSSAVSPTVALETATALQMKIEKVTRKAQEQFQMVLEEQSRFALDVDFDAPKVRVPIRTGGSSKCDSHFLLDFGHFTLHTVESQSDEQRKNLYSRFYISGRDIAAFFTDCGSDCPNCTLAVPSYHGEASIASIPERVCGFYSLIDRCGMAVIVDQIKIPHPNYPSTRISVQVPNLGIHFSPERYCRLMELLSITYASMESCGQPTNDDFQADLAPWSPVDLAISARILVWRGIGNSVATWQPCFLILSGLYLYGLETEKSQSYQRYLSMAGRQVYEVPPANVGGSPFCIAVSFRGMELQKALESSSTWVIEFQNEDEKAIWFKGLIQATYQASAPASVNILGEAINEYGEPQTAILKTADLVINGALVETKLWLYGKADGSIDEKLEESIIIEVLAGGGKVHVIRRDGDLTVKMKLHSLKIKDELQGRVSTAPQYLAFSVLKNDQLHASSGYSDFHGGETPVAVPEDEESFTDALADFMSLSDSGIHSPKMDSSHCPTIDTIGHSAGFESAEALLLKADLVQGKGSCGEIFYEAQGADNSDFVCVTFSTRSSSSPDYDGVDTQMSVRMSKLDFFCNRPTLVALIDFGFDLSSVNYSGGSTESVNTSDSKSLINKDNTEDKGRVRGLLGYGKDRVVFYLNMNIDSVSVFLNKEDGSQLAMFVQESFLLDLKVHPSSLSVEGTLGNFRLRDMSLETDNCWGWLCDIRNPGVESLIKFKFDSYSAEDNDYKGYDYSLFGRLSAVRIVFLYRFVQEITVYFMELATPHTEEAIKLVDKVGGFEWLIQKYEMDGAAALMLDLSLDTPIIIVPSNSQSQDFLQLDFGQLKVTNEFSWHGCPEKDPSAVRLDILHAEILGINMSVGIDGHVGKPMIQEGQGFDVYVRRSLRDVFRKVPTFSLEVKVGHLRGMMSDKEYNVIVNCISMNLCEAPRLPPSFRGSKSASKDTMRLLVDKVNMNGQILLSRTVTIIAVEVNYALLELCTGILDESPLAHIALEGLWVLYRMTSLSEIDLYLTIPKFSILDIRPNMKPEMRLILGSSIDASKQASTGNFTSFLDKGSFRRTKSETIIDGDVPNSTMFLMDYRWRISSKSFVIRVQQPRVLVAPDFLLAVGEFFVPALGSITGREESMDPKNDPIRRNNCIVLSEPVYRQNEDVVHLSPSRQLVADALGVDEYTYDGCGKIIRLSEETDMKELHSAKFRPIVIIGRGKRLQFVNVKIENGSLLRKYTYLSSDSSYTVSIEDGVHIMLVEDSSSDDDKRILGDMHDSLDTLNTSLNAQSDSNKMQSLTFEAQVVSPEFTFFDGTKSSLDDSFYGEKLLRAKMDLSFMYASKENDTWMRALVKDLTVEAGSGLIILDPVDISGGYTSVKEKTNMSMISTDICIHLSLSAFSLLLNLQSQATAALQFGNAIPLAPCTNFDRIWVSPKENGSHNNLTFWRPRAPTNYVILGDCVTSRPIPPSQAVVAVGNKYGRVRKPIGFNLVGLFSDIQGSEKGEGRFDVDCDCSLWMPVAPPGYTALGCVAHLGSQPPQNHVVYCLRSDLVTSTMYSECMFTAPSNACFTSGLSIWRVDNVLGSFYAHSSTDYPPKAYSCDLSHLLLWNFIQHHSSSKESASDLTVNYDYGRQRPSAQSASSSGWDILRSISKASSCYMSTPNFERMWWDKGTDLRRPVSIWRPIARPSYAILGDCITEGLEPPALGLIFKTDNPEISAKPVQFTKVAHIMGKGFDEVFFWYPVAPPGYASLGCVVSRTDEAPCIDSFCCPRMDLVNQANILEVPISRYSSSKASQCWSIWKVENQACTFLARSDLKSPSSRLAYTLGDSVKPKTRENVTAEIKLRCFSLTVLDSLCGTMTPLFDTTITNIKLATHGRLEAMNAVLISSIAASTFNIQLEAWEPLVEPFDGIFKFETYDTNIDAPSRLGKRLRVAATSILNINVSAANLETFVGTIISWRRQLELEQKATRHNEEVGSHVKHADDSTFSALDEADFQTVIVENKLGCDIYLKKSERDSNIVDQLHHGDCASVWIPPPRFSDRLNVADQSREARIYVAIHILEAKGLQVVDDGNSHNFFCALRLVVGGQSTDQQKVFPQSARTKCVKPLISKVNDLNEGIAKWNELFIFEVPRKGQAKLQVEVTNLAAKAGKGEVVGALSFTVGPGANMLKKLASARMLHQPHDIQNIVTYPLTKGVKNNDMEDMQDYGCLSVSTSYFGMNTIANFQKELESKRVNDTGFWVGLGPQGAWESIRSLLPLSVVPKQLQNDYIAMEVFMKNGKKHAIFRGLATVLNDSDVRVDISMCHLSLINDNHTSLGTTSCNTAINPGSSTVLPWKSISKDSDLCLQVRPSADHSQLRHSWGRAVAVGSGYTCGKDQAFSDQGSLKRQNTLKQGNKLPNFTFKLNQLEKKDTLFCCSPGTGSKQFWLSVGTDATILHTELNAPVYDWRISVNSPLKLENRLPCPAEFTIWEKAKEGNFIEREHGIISSRKSSHVYSADIHRPIYLTLLAQGGWVLEKDPVLVLDLFSNDHVSSFWMFHRQSRRRLRVSIERDMGATAAAPKTIRFFTPYWIINDTSLSLAYRVVEIEPSENVDMDSPSLSRAVKSARTALKNPMNSMDRRLGASRRNIQVLEVIEDTSPIPSMLSPQDTAGRSGVVLFPSQKDAYLSPRVGLTVAIRHSEIYGPGISLLELEKKERVDVKAFSSDGSYYKLSALLNMTSDRTKVVHFQPHTLFINRIGSSLCLQQCDSQSVEWIHTTDPPKIFGWNSSAKVEVLKLRVDGYKWSTLFSVCNEGVMRITLKKESGSEQMQLRVEVRSGTKSSRYEVIFRPNSLSTPYRIENRSMFLPIRFRQVEGVRDSWKCLLPNATASFLWEDLGRRHMLELLTNGSDPSKSEKYNIDEIFDHQPIHVEGGPARAIRVTILKEEKINVIKITDWMPENEPTAIMSRRISSSLSQISNDDSRDQHSPSTSDCEFHVIVELAELGISLIDHTPEEILYLSVQNLFLAYSTGLGSGFSRFKLRMRGLQVDNQLPLTPTPVLFRPQKVGEENDYILKISMTLQSNGSLDLCVYPYIGLHGPDNTAFLINIHEPIIWRLHEMIQQVNLSSLLDNETSAVSVDPFIQIGVLNISEVRLKVSMSMSPGQRPKGVLGFWSSLMTALGNTENMPVRLNQRFHEKICMRQSTMISNAIANIKKDLLGQPLQLLSGVDILGNASSALGHMSKGVAALSMDKKFIQSRQRQESKGVGDFGDVIRDGGGALAKGLFRGVTGILTKPLEGAKSSGVEGFVQGVGKGIIGAAAQPVSGVLDLLSKTTEGANAMRVKIASAITSDEQLLRKRLPRVISGDNLLQPYDEYKAQGQVILQLAESGSFFGQVDLFKVRGKFALSDAYEDHFLLPKGRIFVVTHRRVLLLQQPSNIIAQRKFSPARDPCSILWDVMWDDLAIMELTHGKKDHPKSPPTRLIIYLQSKSAEMKEQVRVVKCSQDTPQALEIYSSIERAKSTYGPNLSKEIQKKKMAKPYAPVTDGTSVEVVPKDAVGSWSTQQVPPSLPLRSTFGSSTN